MIAKTLRGVGQTLITAGLVILLFCVYELYFTGLETRGEQKKGRAALLAEWAVPARGPDTPIPGSAPIAEVDMGAGLAILRIPRLGRSWAKVVFEGVRVDDLKKGPGHYPSTALPGAIGNFVVSGHRTTYGAPFNQIDELDPGDAVVVETRDRWFTYRMVKEEIVAPTEVDVILPVPRRPTERATKALMTMTTCHPKYSARQRLIVYFDLTDTTMKSPGVLPPALQA